MTEKRTKYSVVQVFQANGFRVVECCVDFDDSKTVDFFDLPVLGWAVLRPVEVKDRKGGGGDSWWSNSLTSLDYFDLVVWDLANEDVCFFRELTKGGNFRFYVLPPEDELNEDKKKDLEHETRRSIADEERAQELNRKILTLHREGLSVEEIQKRLELRGQFAIRAAIEEQR